MKFEQSPWTVAKAIAYVMELWQQDRITGRMDSEHSSYQIILNKIQSGEISPEEGVRQAQQLSGGRQEGAFIGDDN